MEEKSSRLSRKVVPSLVMADLRVILTTATPAKLRGTGSSYTRSAGEENMTIIASARTKQLAAMLLINAVALISPSMALAHSSGGSSGGGHSGGGSSSSGSHSSGHATVSSSSHRTTAVSQGRTHTTSSKKRWSFFGRRHAMNAGCLSQPVSTTLTATRASGCDVYKSSAKPGAGAAAP